MVKILINWVGDILVAGTLPLVPLRSCVVRSVVVLGALPSFSALRADWGCHCLWEVSLVSPAGDLPWVSVKGDRMY